MPAYVKSSNFMPKVFSDDDGSDVCTNLFIFPPLAAVS
jgi:hypothetical protein